MVERLPKYQTVRLDGSSFVIVVVVFNLHVSNHFSSAAAREMFKFIVFQIIGGKQRKNQWNMVQESSKYT